MPTNNARCFECSDIGFVVERNVKKLCWRRSYPHHNTPNAAALMLERAVEHLMVRKLIVEPQHFEIAKLLARYTTAAPFTSARLLETHFVLPLRSFMGIIEDLRRVWLLPVGSRKSAPVGYWIITDQADFASWVERAKAAPITQLTTIHAVARRNFPVFAEQLELEFWQDMRGSDAVRQMKEAA